MMPRILLAALMALGVFFPRLAPAQYPFVPPGYSHTPQLPPLLYIRLAGPEGMKATFHRPGLKPQTFATPCVLGVRPGYSFRMALSNITGLEGKTFFPTVDARASLLLAEKLRPADFPATLRFTTEEFNRVLGNVILKKVIVLERVDNAIPQATKAEQPIEIVLEGNRDVFSAARTDGAPMAVLHLGEKQLVPEEMAIVPGTVLLPGEKVLPPPRVAPWLPWACLPVDPVAGVAHPAEWMSLEDGGDVGLRAGVDRRRGAVGVDPTDTVATYEDSRGRKRLAVSNRVGLCVPRFLIVAGETQVQTSAAARGPGGAFQFRGHKVIDVTRQTAENSQKSQLELSAGRQRAGGTINTMGTAVLGKMQGLDVVGTFRTTGTVDGSCPPPTLAGPADGPLEIIKWPDLCAGLVGDVITFTLKYRNTGGLPISNIEVLDSLGPRFEYVPGSARADRDAFFSTEMNEAGSLVLRWEIQGRLLPRDSGLVSFQVRIR